MELHRRSRHQSSVGGPTGTQAALAESDQRAMPLRFVKARWFADAQHGIEPERL